MDPLEAFFGYALVGRVPERSGGHSSGFWDIQRLLMAGRF